MSEAFWSVDSLIVKNNAIFGFGWIFFARKEITALHLKLTFRRANLFAPDYIMADVGKQREDVERTFPGEPKALNSGYVVFGAFPAGAQLESINLVCSLDDNSIIELTVPPSSVVGFFGCDEAEKNNLILRQSYVFFKRGLHLVRSGKFTSLFEKVQRYLRGRPKVALHKPSDLAAILRSDERTRICLVIDHDLGGGANHYRYRFVDSIVQEGRTAIVLTFHVATLTHMLILRNRRVNLRFSIPDKAFVIDAVRFLSITDIVYNTAVSFVKPEEIPPLLIGLKRITSARLTILVHDLFLICPSHFLIDHAGVYCGIPDINVCTGCLQRNQQGFANLFVARDIRKWRSIWGSTLAVSDEIVAFSKNTLDLLLEAYPKAAGLNLSVVPHRVNHLTGKIPNLTNIDRLCIGVVGQIGFHKGSLVVKALAQEIKRRNVDLKIVIIGTIETNCEKSVVSQTGAYNYERLPNLIERTGVNVMLFPSIWPETFSYVVQELMEMSLPIASFNFGAPAERLTSYSRGLVLVSMNVESVLDELILFHRKIYITSGGLHA